LVTTALAFSEKKPISRLSTCAGVMPIAFRIPNAIAPSWEP
jgi:hypothetical protein